MIKVFALNKNNKIELTKQELEKLLNESFWEGYNQKNYWTYSSPTASDIIAQPCIIKTDLSTTGRKVKNEI